MIHLVHFVKANRPKWLQSYAKGKKSENSPYAALIKLLQRLASRNGFSQRTPHSGDIYEKICCKNEMLLAPGSGRSTVTTLLEISTMSMRQEFGTTCLQSVFELFATRRQRFGARRTILRDSRQCSLSEPMVSSQKWRNIVFSVYCAVLFCYMKKILVVFIVKKSPIGKIAKEKCHVIQKVF
ncbi:hypothetical protein JG687_00012490 [Phytophthora cactorum]|uniref:Uncharacterized protein n=1 Tax=Phytophthora cactorum TaxID=29920 RepID=A0A8T1U3R6_9STRA|nr:hypothetical protein JG687_00012490 [Phytophthora cactorum]